MNNFINREKELAFLEKKYREKKSQLILIYGRRRVGKTELLRQFAKEKNSIYYFVENIGIENHLENFSEILSKKFDLPLQFKSFEQLFDFLSDKKMILILDEFQEIIRQDKNFLNQLQKIWDSKLKNENLFLVLVGSAVSVFHKMLSYGSPIYGRRTGDWKVEQLSFFELDKFFKKYSREDLIKTFGVLGGVPEYLLKFNSQKSFWKNVEEEILTKGSFLYSEMQLLLRYELKELGTYLSILKSISEGVNRLGEIASKNFLEATTLPKYLDVLIELGFVEYILPFPYKARKKGIYVIKDNFTWFWFRFVFQNKNALENFQTKQVLTEIKRDFNKEFGPRFEFIARDFLNFKYSLDFRKGWYREIDIDLLAEDSKKREFFVFEVKWREIGINQARKILVDLEEKLKKLPIKQEKYKKIKFGLVAKKITGKNILKKEGFDIFDLRGFEKNKIKQK
jgi:hypothetical protein